MLLLENPIRQRVHGVPREDRHGGLGHDRPGVQLVGHDVDRAAADLDAGAQGGGLRLGGHAAGEGGQQRGVDIQDAVAVGRDDGRAQD